LLWVLSLSDGAHDLLSIAQRSGLDFASLDRAASALEKSGLVKTLPEPAP
jgi:aminopeptidase-like protein